MSRFVPALVPLTLAVMVCGGLAAAARAVPPAGFVLATEREDVTVGKIDPETDTIVGRGAVGSVPSALAVDRVRRWVYVSAHLDDKVAVLNPDTLEAADLAVPGLGKRPIGVSLTPDGQRLLVATRGTDGIISPDDRLDVVELDTSSWPPTGSLLTSIPTGLHPVTARIDRNGRYAVVTVRNEPAILIVDLQTYQVVAQAQNLPPNAEPEGADAHPTQNVVYVTLHGPMSTIEVIDLDTLSFVRHVPIVHTPPAQPSTGAFTADGGRFYVSGQSVNKVFMFDTSDPYNPVQNMSVQLPVGPQPHFIVYLPDGRAYVANTNNGQPFGSLSIIHDYGGTPTVSGPILTDLAGPLGLAKLPSLGSGDYEYDGDVDLADFAEFSSCLTGPRGGLLRGGCGVFDFDFDDDVDLADFAAFQQAVPG